LTKAYWNKPKRGYRMTLQKVKIPLSKAINVLETVQQEVHSNPAKALRMMRLAQDNISVSYIALAKRLGHKVKD